MYSEICHFIMIWEKKSILRFLKSPWTKSLKITCFSEFRELTEGMGARTLCVDALTLHY